MIQLWLGLATILVYSSTFTAAIPNKPSSGGPVHSPRGLNNISDAGPDLVERSLERRFEGAKFTFYDAGLGACGRVNSNSDFIVALTAQQWDGGAHCFSMVTITVNGKTATAQITDECMGCPYGGLDFSRGLFDYFASESLGIIYGSWYFGSGAAAAPPTTTTTTYHQPAPRPTPTSTPKPTPTPTPKPKPKPTPTPTPIRISPTTTRRPPSPSPAVSSATVSQSLIAVDPVSPTLPTAVGNLESINLAFIAIGGIAYALHSN